METPRLDRGGGVPPGGSGGRRWRGLLVALAAFAFFVVQVAPAAADPDEDRLAQLAREKQELERAAQISRQNAERYRQEASRFQAAVSAANARITDLAGRQTLAQTEADILKIEIEISEEQLALVAFQLNETASLIDSLKAQTAEQAKQLVTRQDLYAMHLRTTYLQAQVSPLEMLLSSRSLTEFTSRVQAMVLINRQDQQLVRDIRSLKGSTAQKEAAVIEKELEIKGLQSQIETQKASLAKKKADHERIVAEMKASISTQSQLRTEASVNRNNAIGAQQQANAETARLNRQLEQTEAAYARLAAELALRSGLGAFNGRMAIWPVSGPITSYYGPRWGGFHNGLDVAAPLNTPIRAAAAGQVVTVGKPYLAYGDTATVVIIAHGSNFSTLYGHMSDAPGPRGPSGYVGMTGWTTGPHVHFMTVVDGRTVDPLPYMPR